MVIIDKAQQTVIEKISRLVQNRVGIQIGPKQKQQVTSALTKRIRELGLENWDAYNRYFLHHIATETEIVVSLLTTHHTFFFREFPQFEYLKEQLIPMAESIKKQGRKHIEVWSAACSYGQEVYSLAMFLDFELRFHKIDLGFRILGSDVDEKAVNLATNGVYKWSELKEVPRFYLANHWARGTGEIADYCKAKSSLKDFCSFDTINLQKIGNSLGSRKFDIVFCRNVFIYFSKQQIRTISGVVSRNLYDHGLFFVGLSETLSEEETSLVTHGRSVYGHAKTEAGRRPPKPQERRPRLEVIPGEGRAEYNQGSESGKELKVFCVDDSDTVLALLSKVFVKDRGFRIIGTAKDGIEAEKKIPGSGADIVTLDIHMPGMDGISYLEKNHSSNHPPVVMISSVSQDDAELASAAMKAGAIDFVEKPTIQTMLKSSEEISFKVRQAWKMRDAERVMVDDPSTGSFYRVRIIPDTDSKVRIMVLSAADIRKGCHIVSQLKAPQPPTMILIDCPESLFSGLKKESAQASGLKTTSYSSVNGFLSNRIYIEPAEDFIVVQKSNLEAVAL